jgi:hypothetical protein
MPTTNNIFSYSSNPLPVKPSASRKKYKDDGNNFTLMSDPRVVRGMVSSSLKKPSEKISKDPSSSSSSHRHNHGRPNIDEKNEKRQDDEMNGGTTTTGGGGGGGGMYSYHVSSIVQENIDVTQYLIEQETMKQKPILKVVHETQTDDFQDRPVTPEFIPKKQELIVPHKSRILAISLISTMRSS